MSRRPCRATCGLLAAAVMHATVASAAPVTALRVPAGHTVELAAAAPLVAHPLMADFDDEGRLYVAANAGENLSRAELERRLPNFVQRLEDVDGDGVFDRATVFADRMTFPQGCLWQDGSLYVASSGAIWRLTDTDDDGIADDRRKLVGDFGYTGNAADVHGPFAGPDGRIYWCEGRHGHEIRDRDGGLVSRGKAARIFSCRSDGSDVRTFCSGGMDNPVEVCFTPTGEMLGTVNLMYSRPRGDCLVHWQHGGVYPREDFADSLGVEFVRTGPLLAEVHNFGHVAVSGLCAARGGMFGGPDGGAGPPSLFVTQFNTHRVVRLRLDIAGPSFTVAAADDFLVSDDTDVHPTDVLEDADGSLLVIDTGGWFRIGCPQSQVSKPDIRGSIIRVRRTAAPRVDDPRGRRLEWRQATVTNLVERLGDARPAVVDRAAAALVARLRTPAATADAWREMATVAVRQSPAVRRRLAGTLARIDTPAAVDMLVGLTRDADPHVRQTAIRAALYTDFSRLPGGDALATSVIDEIRGGSPLARCVALATAGRLAATRPTVAAAVVDVAGPAVTDILGRHALAYALISSGGREAAARGLASSDEAVRDAAATALETLRRSPTAPEAGRWLEIPAAAPGRPLSGAERDHLVATEAALPPGDADRGRELFISAQAACSKCHRVGAVGGEVGPDLSTIGRSRSRRDLLESILYPSASYARGFASYTIVTQDGKARSGIILGESPTHVRLGINAATAERVAVHDIEEIHATDLSIMPADVARQLSQQQLADLVAHLQSLQQPLPAPSARR